MLGTYRNEVLVKRDTSSADYVPFAAHVDANTLKTKQGDFVQVFRLEGIAHETADDDEINTWHEQLNMFMRNINSPHVVLWTHVVRKESGEYVGGTFRPGFAADLNVKYRASVTGKRLFVNELYLTLLYRPQPMALARAFQKVDELTAHGKAESNGLGVERINNLAKEVEKNLSRYDPERLTSYEHNGFMYSEPLEFYQYLVNGYEQRFPLVRGNVQNTLVTSRPLFGREAMEFRAPDRSMVGALLGIKEYPHPTVPGLFNELLRAPYEFVLTQSFVCIDKASARTALKRQRDRLESTGDDALEQIDELNLALNDLQSNKFTMGEHHLALLVKGEDVKALANNVAEARAALGDSGCVVAREDLALEAAFWSQLPGNFKWRPRPAPINSYNFVGMSAFHNYPTGKRTGNHWGDAVALLKTTSGAPYFFNYHKRDLGITLLTGQSGTGKTATQNFLSAQAEKFDATGIYLDKDRGSEIFVLANGGRYFSAQVQHADRLRAVRTRADAGLARHRAAHRHDLRAPRRPAVHGARGARDRRGNRRRVRPVAGGAPLRPIAVFPRAARGGQPGRAAAQVVALRPRQRCAGLGVRQPARPARRDLGAPVRLRLHGVPGQPGGTHADHDVPVVALRRADRRAAALHVHRRVLEGARRRLLQGRAAEPLQDDAQAELVL